jgi:hypothetical protein
VDNIVQYRITKDMFIKVEHRDCYKLKYIDLDNYANYINDFKITIDLLHKQLKWDGIPTLEQCYERFKANSFCLLFYYNGNCIGWNWGNQNVTVDWINVYKKLAENELYFGGCFVSRLVEKPADAGSQDYNMCFNYCLNVLNANTVYAYCDRWNKAAIRLNLNNGCREYEFL